LREWEAASEQAKAEGKPAPRKPGVPRDPRKDQHNPTLTYNAMIAPLRPYTIRGALWYQGESNGWDNYRYLPIMQTLIADWRRKWDDEFPFLFVQLASYKAPATQPVASSQIASVREAQRLTLTVPGTAMAVTIDIGDARDVHPHNKQEVGRRLALAARATVYGENLAYSGPLFRSATRFDDRVEIAFDHAQGLKAGEPSTTQPFAYGSAVQGFSLLIDGQWSWAEARIEGEKVVLPLQPGQKPSEVRYAWADFPICNLANGADLPASPFRAELQD
jgi:sialate O-acetylesterase